MTYWEPGKESDYHSGHVINLSDTGVFVTTDAPLSPPARVNLRLVLGERKIDVPGEVVRSIGETQFVVRDGTSGMGVRFRDPTSEHTRTLLAHGMEESDSLGS